MSTLLCFQILPNEIRNTFPVYESLKNSIKIFQPLYLTDEEMDRGSCDLSKSHGKVTVGQMTEVALNTVLPISSHFALNSTAEKYVKLICFYMSKTKNND